MIGSKSVSQMFAILGRDKPHVLDEEILAIVLFFMSGVRLVVLVNKFVEGFMDVIVMVVDELSHGVHGVSVVDSRSGPSVT